MEKWISLFSLSFLWSTIFLWITSMLSFSILIDSILFSLLLRRKYILDASITLNSQHIFIFFAYFHLFLKKGFQNWRRNNNCCYQNHFFSADSFKIKESNWDVCDATLKTNALGCTRDWHCKISFTSSILNPHFHKIS